MAHTKSPPKALMSGSVQQLATAANNIRKDPDGLGAMMAPVGYGPAKLDILTALYAEGSTSMSDQVEATGVLREKTAALNRAEATVRQAVVTLASACRHEFADQPEELAKLLVAQRVPDQVAPLITYGVTLFDNASSDQATASRLAADFGYTPERFTGERAKVDGVIGAVRDQKEAKGAAQLATARQNAVIAKVRRELSALRAMARQALKDEPQMLEKLGITVRNTPTAAQRAAGKKAAATRKANKAKEPVGV